MHAPGPWATFLSVSPDNLERAVTLCREVIADYIAEGPREPELEDERQSLSGAYQVGLATNTGVARELVSVLTSGVPLSHLDTYPERLRSTGRREVVDALHRHVRPAELVVAAAGSLAEE
jgi:zinc protease